MPLLRTQRMPCGAKFSQRRAQRAVDFVEKVCVHTKSSWARKKFKMHDWQRGSVTTEEDVTELFGIVAPLFGTMKWSPMWNRWVRQFQVAWIEMARKNGKSELMAALGLYLLIADGEWSAEIIGAASDKAQASAVFNVARDMIRLSPVLSKMEKNGEIEIVDSRKTIFFKKTMSTYKVVSADAMANLGANPYAILFDEVLAQPGRALWDYLKQGFGTRPNQLLIGVTTAGPDRESFAYSEHEHSVQCAADPDLDPSRFVFMAFVEEDADWKNEALWPEANPGIWTEDNPTGFLNIDQLRAERDEAIAKGDLAAQANFRIFRLNQWGNAATRWLDMAVWDDSELLAGTFKESDIKDVWAVGGLDLADTTDLTAWVLVFQTPERTMIKPHFWITRKAIETKHKKRKEKFTRWEELGLVTVFGKDAHDYDRITNHILNDIEKYKISHIGYDQYQAPAVVNKIEGRTDVVCIKIPQTTTRMNPGSMELTRLMGARKLTANGNPILRWNAESANYKRDNEGHIKPDKVNSKEAIDGLVALVDALTAMVGVEQDTDLNIHVFESCAQCGSDDYREYGRYASCSECGHRWTLREEDDDAVFEAGEDDE